MLAIRLQSRPETKEMAPEIRAEVASIREGDDVWLEARQARIAASAEIVYLDEKVGEDVMDLSRAALVEVKGDRNDERYKRVFIENPSEALKPVGGSKQTRFVRAVINQVGAESTPFPALRDRASAIDGSLTALSDAEARRDALYVPEATALAERRARFEKACRTYNLTYPRLQLIFPNDPRLVESFFLGLSSRDKDEND